MIGKRTFSAIFKRIVIVLTVTLFTVVIPPKINIKPIVVNTVKNLCFGNDAQTTVLVDRKKEIGQTTRAVQSAAEEIAHDLLAQHCLQMSPLNSAAFKPVDPSPLIGQALFLRHRPPLV
jgi:hypothetical protein